MSGWTRAGVRPHGGPTTQPAAGAIPAKPSFAELLIKYAIIFSPLPVCFSLPQPKWADLTPAGHSGARFRGVRSEPCGDPAPLRATGAEPPLRMLGLFLRETGVGNKNSKCGVDERFAAVGVGVWTQPHTCYPYGLYTRFTSLRTPWPGSGSAFGEQSCGGGAARRARGRAGAGVGAEDRSAASRGLPAADSPWASLSPPHPSPHSVVIPSGRFWEDPPGWALRQPPRGLCSDGHLPSVGR